MRKQHDRSQILGGALDAAVEEGLSSLTFGRIARRLGINDRTIVYYFPTKADLITEVITSVGIQLHTALADAVMTPAADHLELARTAWPVLAHDDTDPIFALFFEANGLAAAGIDPYQILVPELVRSWISWACGVLVGTSGQRRTEATAAIAVLDGLLLLRQLTGPDSAHRAAQRLGVA